MGESRTPAEQIADALAHYLGPNTARTAVRTFAGRALGRLPEAVSLAEAPALLDALRPMLRTLLGNAPADRLLAELRESLR